MEELGRNSPTPVKDDDDQDLFSSSPPATDASSDNRKKSPVNDDAADDGEDLFSPYIDLPAATSGDATTVSTPAVKPGNTAVTAELSDNDIRQGPDMSIPEETEAEKRESAARIEIQLTEPRKVGDMINSYVTYKVTTRTDIKHFRGSEMVVTRRYSDFLGLYEKLVTRYQTSGIIIPPPPEKSFVGMTKMKMSKEETGAMDFVEKRRAALERFINRVAKHPRLRSDTDFVDFVELDSELPKATNTSALSGAGFVRLLNRVGDSIGKMTYTMTEPDEWFEDKTEQLDLVDHDMQELHAAIELLVCNRKDLSQSTGLLAKSVGILGSAEENVSLSKGLSHLAEVETRIEQLHADQADTDFFVLSELVKDYVNVIHTIRDVLHERVKVHKAWKDTEFLLGKKQEEKSRLEQQHKTDKLPTVNAELGELEQRVKKCETDFVTISQTVKQELMRFERQRVRDFKAMLINYLQHMLNYQQQIATCWEAFLPEAQEIV